MNKKLMKNVTIFLKGWVFSIFVAILIATSVRSSLADWNDIPSGSMEPTILIGDRVFVNKLAYDLKIPYTTVHLAKWSDPKRGDIVVFYHPKEGTRLIKRVIGIPGDTLAMRENHLFINGKFINYDPLQLENFDQLKLDQQDRYIFLNEKLNGKEHALMLTPSRSSLSTFAPVIIPEGQYFMMGDNRDNSKDSRFFGFADRNLIVGRATMVVISKNESFLHPRWSRFFKDLI